VNRVSLTGRIMLEGRDAIPPVTQERVGPVREPLLVAMEHEIEVTDRTNAVVLVLEEVDPGDGMQVDARFECEYLAR
jgi:hypothetical protein